MHGLCASDVCNAPTFDALWSSVLCNSFCDSILVAHNASFDMRVLNKCLLAYQLPLFDALHLCTRNMAQRLHVPAPDYQLPSLCDYFGVTLANHYDALEDAMACEQVFWAMLSERGIDAPNGIPYIWDQHAKTNHAADNTAQAMIDLYGIAIGVAIDGRILPSETRALTKWQSRNAANKKSPFFEELFDYIDTALVDGVLSMEERNAIVDMTAPFVSSNNGSPQTFALQQLIGILRGISADGIVNEIEAANLKAWLDESSDLAIPEFISIADTIDRVLADGVITPEESSHLLDMFDRVIDPTADTCEASIKFVGSKFCLTGDFTHGSKSDIESEIVSRGGEIAKSVSVKVSYVVVGGQGSAQYAFGNYGTKVKKAMELIEKGKPIQIITEDVLFDAF